MSRSSGSIATVPHVSASGKHVEHWWQFLPASGLSWNRILASVVLASAKPVEICVDICVTKRPRSGAFVIVRLSETTYQLTPLCWPEDFRSVAHAKPFRKFWPVGPIDLTMCPASVALELEAI